MADEQPAEEAVEEPPVEEMEEEPPLEDEAPVEEAPPPEEEAPPPDEPPLYGEEAAMEGACGPGGAARPCDYRPKKRKISYVWGPPKERDRFPSYSPCPHIYFKNMRENIQRDGLNRDDWMEILSTPNPTPWERKGPKGEKLVRYRRKPCSKRTKQLAIPRIALVRANWEEYRGTLSEERCERLRQILADDFHMTPEEIRALIKRGKKKLRKRRRRRKKRKSSVPEELTEEEYMRSLLTQMADRATEIAEYEKPVAGSRLEVMVTTILERLAALAGEPPPPRDATGLIARLMIIIAEKLAAWIENVVAEADSVPDVKPCAQGLDFLRMFFCAPNCLNMKQLHGAPCGGGGKKHTRKRRSKSPKQKTCGGQIVEIQEEPPKKHPECKCACLCESPRRRRRRKKGRRKGKGKRRHGSRDEEESEEEGSVELSPEEEDESGEEGEEGEEDAGEGEGEDEGAQEAGDEGGGDEGEGGGDGEVTEGEGEPAATEDGGDDQKGGGTDQVGSAKSSKGSKPGSANASKSSANAAGSKSSANAGGSKSSANARGSKSSANAAASKTSPGGSKSNANAAGSKSSANAGGSKSSANAAGSKSSANAAGSKSSANAGGSKSSANAGGSKSSANASAAKSKSSAEANKSKESASKVSSKSKTDDGGAAYKVTSDDNGVLTIEKQEPEPVEEPSPIEEEPPAEEPPAEEPPTEEPPAEEPAEEPEEPEEPGDLEEKISEMGENLADDAIEEGVAQAQEGDLPNVTFGSVLRQLSQMIEDIPDAEKSERRDKLMHTLEKKFTALVEADETPHATEGMEEVVADVADKVATWMDGVIREAESRISQASAGRVPSQEVREWADWIVGAMGVAEEWADWISSTVAAAEEKAREKRGEAKTSTGEVKKLTRQAWAEWKQSVREEGTDFRAKKRVIKEAARDWERRAKGKRVGARDDPTTSSNEMQQEKEEKVIDMEVKSKSPDTPP